MHTFKSYIVITLTGLFLLGTFSSCKKKQEVDSETESVLDYTISDRNFTSIALSVISKGTLSSKQAGFKVNTCGQGLWVLLGNDTTSGHFQNDTLTDASNQYINGPVNFVIDYNQTTGCADIDNVTKTGKINIKSSHKWSAASTQTVNSISTATITLDNYVADGITINGTIKLTRTINGNSITVRTEVMSGNCTKDGWNTYYTCNKLLTQDNAGNFTSTGDATGINRLGKNYTATITNPVFKPLTNKYCTSGVLDITPDGLKTRTLNFGNGSMDDKATFMVNGQTFEFIMQ